MNSLSPASAFLQHLFVSSGVILAAGFMLHAALRRRPAAVRELLWRTVFTVLLLLPLTWLLRPWGLRREDGATPAAADFSSLEQPAAPSVAALPPAERTLTPAAEKPDSRMWIVWCIWGAGSLVLLTRMAGAPLLRRRWLSAARTCEDTRVNALWRSLSLSGPPRARLLVSPACPVPLAWHRTIVLPEAALQWSDDQVRAALQHEAAHLLRGDPFFRLAGECAAALLWPQLLLWPARRLWHRLQEQACDDAVLRQGSDAASYAGLLCQAARGWRHTAPATLAMAQPSSLEQRIRAVLDPGRNRARCQCRHVAAAVVTGLMIFAGAALAQKPATPPPATPGKGADAANSPDKAKAKKLVVPRAAFAEASLQDVILFLTAKSKEIDPDKKGIVIKAAPAGVTKKVTLDLRNVSMWDLLTSVAEITGTRLEAGPDGISFVAGDAANPKPKTASGSPLQKKADNLRIPKVVFQDATIKEMIEHLQVKSRDVDDGEKDAAKKGVTIRAQDAGKERYSLTMADSSVWQILTEIAKVSGMNPPAVSASGSGAGMIVLTRGDAGVN